MKNELLGQIKKYNKIIIHRHQKPDGDALGSQFGLREVIKNKFPEKEVLVYGSKDEYSENSISNIFKEDFDQIDESTYEGALVIVVDTANAERIEGEYYDKGDLVFKIDHHASGDSYTEYEWVEAKTSSNCEMITRWARENELTIGKDGAKYLLTGMVTDTGRFMFNSVSDMTFHEASHLMREGAKINKIANALNDRDINFIRLQGYILSNLKFENGVSHFILPEGAEEEFGVDYNTASSLVFLLMSFTEADYAAYLSFDKINNVWKGSLRSKKRPINTLAEKYGGGGHEMASGFKIQNVEQFEEVVKDLHELKNQNK